MNGGVPIIVLSQDIGTIMQQQHLKEKQAFPFISWTLEKRVYEMEAW